MNGPDPNDEHPMKGFPRVCFIKNTVASPNIVVGDYTYYDDPEDSEGFERNVLGRRWRDYPVEPPGRLPTSWPVPTSSRTS